MNYSIYRGTLFIIIFALAVFAAQTVSAQTTEFTYQGRLSDNSMPGNTNYDFEFRLYNAGGILLGTQPRPAVPVSNGVFTVQLDFGAQFDGSARFLEIAVKPAGGGSFTTLTPRQPVTSALYSIRSLSSASADTAINSQQLGGTAANQFVQTGDARLSDERAPAAGSSNYIQNNSGVPQTGANFNIDGTGAANIFNATTQYNIGGNRVFTVNGTSNGNTFAGVSAGLNNTGNANTFVGRAAGRDTTSGNSNSFFGWFAGSDNQNGFQNSFFGARAGGLNLNTGNNAFFGFTAGGVNKGAQNSFFGAFSGQSSTSGDFNAFYGFLSGAANKTGNNNTALGTYSDFGADNLTYAAAVGSNAIVNSNDTIVLGKIAGTYNGIARSADTVQIPGNLNVDGIFSGIGSNLTNLNASNFSSGTLSTQRGGTEVSSSGAAGNYLRSNGNRWISSAIQTSDLPDLSGSYIQNSSSQQTGSFNIAGTGRANTFTASFINATTQFNSNGSRVLAAGFGGANNLFVGLSAGAPNPVGNFNTFVGAIAGSATSSGNSNSFFGSNAGSFNNGNGNSFFGDSAGNTNASGSNNTLIGSSTGVNASNLNNATAIGANALVTQSNSLVLGSINGTNGATASTNVGIGTTAPNSKLQVTGGNIYITQPNSLIITSPNGACWFVTVNNAGALSTISVACP